MRSMNAAVYGSISSTELTTLAIDPGSQKCGLAVVRRSVSLPENTIKYKTLTREITPTLNVFARVGELLQGYAISFVVLGDATGSKALQAVLKESLSESTPLIILSEKFTTERARERYFQENPPRYAKAILHTLGLLVPPCPVDDHAAVILAEDFFRSRQSIDNDALPTP